MISRTRSPCMLYIIQNLKTRIYLFLKDAPSDCPLVVYMSLSLVTQHLGSSWYNPREIDTKPKPIRSSKKTRKLDQFVFRWTSYYYNDILRTSITVKLSHPSLSLTEKWIFDKSQSDLPEKSNKTCWSDFTHFFRDNRQIIHVINSKGYPSIEFNNLVVR